MGLLDDICQPGNGCRGFFSEHGEIYGGGNQKSCGGKRNFSFASEI